MEFQKKYTEEQEGFREEVRAFLEENIPKELVLSPDIEDYTYEQYQVLRKLGRKLGERGWLYPRWPKEYGGGGLPMDLSAIVIEEAHNRGLDLAPYSSVEGNLGGASILLYGTEEQKRFFVSDGFTKGKWIVQQVITEPQGGSDATNVKVIAVRDGDDYIVNGQKTFISDGGAYECDYLWTSVCTDPRRPKHENLSYLMIPANLPGITIRPMDLLKGVGYIRSNEIFFDDVRVPAFNRISEENEGWKVMSTTLELEHGGAAGPPLTNHVVEKFFAYCKEAQFNGQPLSKDPDVRDRLVDIHIDSEINRLLGLRNFWIYSTKMRLSYEAAQSSYVRKMSGLRIADAMQQILGYFVLTTDPWWVVGDRWVEAFMREAIIQIHAGGTADIHKGNMTRRLGIGRLVKEEAPPMLQPV